KLGLELHETRVPGGLRHEAARARVIRMPIRGKRREDDAWPRPADGLDDTELGRAVRPQAAVPEVERLAEARPEDPRGFPRLSGPDLRRAARRHLAAREVHDYEAQPARRQGSQRPATSEIGIVGVRREGEDVDRLDVHREIT